jgi:hypothetical protein
MKRLVRAPDDMLGETRTKSARSKMASLLPRLCVICLDRPDPNPRLDKADVALLGVVRYTTSMAPFPSRICRAVTGDRSNKRTDEASSRTTYLLERLYQTWV